MKMIKFNSLSSVLYTKCGFHINCVGKYNTKYYYLNKGYLNVSKFHTSVFFYSDKDNELYKRIQELKNVSDINKETSLGAVNIDGMKKSLLEFESQISQVKNEEITQEIKDVENYLQSNNSSSFDESFPNYAGKKVVVDDNDTGVLEVIKELKEVLDKCKSAGIEKNYLEQIKISGVVEKVLSKDTNKFEDIKNKVGNVVTEELYEIMNKIGNITLFEVYEKIKVVKSKLDLNININYAELGLSLVSYGLLLKTYNKCVHNRPFPKGLISQDLIVARQVRYFSRCWFAGLVAPLMVFSFHQLRNKNSLLNFNIIKSDSETDINSTKKSIFSFLFLLKKPNNWVIIISIFILLLIFFILDGMSFIDYCTNWYNESYYPYFKVFLLFSIIIPILINVFILYLLRLIEIKGDISILKLLPSIFNSFITYLIKIGTNKEFLNYYRGRGYAEILFYVVILLLVLIFF